MNRTIVAFAFTALCLLGVRGIAGPTNAILFIADDVSWNDYGCYGNDAARTPNIDQLAAQGIRFDRAYLTASSCSPSRSSIVTGRYPHNNGKAAELHQPISIHLPWFPELLREAGYFTAISGKRHMRTTAPAPGQPRRPFPFDQIDNGKGKNSAGGAGNWLSVTRDRPKDKPFFFWFASYDAHRGWDADNQWKPELYGAKHRAEDVTVPSFLVDDQKTREDLASYYNEVTRFDYHIGLVVAELKRQGVFEDTLIFVLADNGRPFPRAKTRLHDSGMKTALVAHWPNGLRWTGASDQLVSVIDLAPTILSAAGVPVSETMQGHSMLPLFVDRAASIRRYAFSEHNWHDYEALGRSVRHGDYLLVRNERNELPWQGPADSVRSESHQALLERRAGGELTDAQADVFLAPRPAIALYHVASDPLQLANLADEPDHVGVQETLMSVLQRWMEETGDSVPDKISPDTFHRETGKRLAKSEIDDAAAITPGEDRGADRTNAKGPY